MNKQANKRFLVPAAVLAATAWIAAAPPTATAQQGLDRIVAIVEDEAITERQLAKNLRRAQAMLSQQNREMPDVRALTAQVLQQMIVQQLQLQEAKKTGITIDDITLDRAVEDTAKRNNLTLAEFKQKVESGGGDFQEWRERIRDELAIQQLVQRDVINRIEVSKQEVEDVLMLDENRRRNAEYHLVHIRVPPRADDLADDQADDQASGQTTGEATGETLAAVKKRFAGVRRKLRGDSFSSLDSLRKRFAQLWRGAAAEDGLKGLRYQVKDLEWQRAEDLPAPVRRRMDSLRDNGISPVISNDDGVHLFQLLASRSDSPEMMQKQYQVRHILIRTTPVDDDEAVRRKLLNLKRRIEDGADFGALACAHSDDPLSSMKDGELGWSSPQGYVPEFTEAVTQARGEGDIVGPFKTAFGWHILEVLGVREHDVGDDTMRRQAIAEIRKGKSEEETRLWLLELRENRRVEIRI